MTSTRQAKQPELPPQEFDYGAKFRYFPPPREGEKYGPTDFQRMPFIDEMPLETRREIAHLHDLDILLMLGATRCFGLGTEIKMFDGSAKRIETIEVGDQVIGADNTRREVLSLSHGRDEMFEIVPGSREYRKFVCNGNHTLALRTDECEAVRVFTVNDYLALPEPYRQSLKLFKADPESPSGFTVNRLGEGNYFGFAIDGEDQFFQLADGTVTHNSGKTLSCVARGLKTARRYHNAKIFVGSLNYKHLFKTVVKDYQRLLTIKSPWDHPSVIDYPRKQGNTDLIVRTADGKSQSTITFMNLKEWGKVLGTEADLWHIEEPELLQDEEALEAIVTRMSSVSVPWKQILLSANPIGHDLDWLIKWFRLEQYEAGYTGPKIPIGKPCRCHLCGDCEAKGEVSLFIDRVCPVCNKRKQTECPGGQYFKRVVLSDASMNPHLRDSYRRDLLDSVSEDKQVALGQGLIFTRARGKIYTGYSKKLVYEKNKEIDFSKPIIWTHDFNNVPMCSVILQEFEEDGQIHLEALEEIVIRNADATMVAQEFISRYKGKLKNVVKLYGDPAGCYGHIRGKELDRYDLMKQMLEKEGGFVVEKKIWSTKFSIDLRFDSLNTMMRGIHPVTGEEVNRIHINPKLVWLIKSLEETKWNKAGKKEDEINDHKYRDKGRDGELWGLSHPAAALGYLVVVEFPVVKQEAREVFATLIAPEMSMHLTEADRIEVVRNDDDRNLLKERDEFEDELELRIAKEIEEELEYEPRIITPASMLRSQGLWRL
jgi:hypothetical protein